ncbi:uncharacterized protein LOC135216369 isoform X2 [Macrobrachium nipponense]|uniref:uncharacterized protein LOC135216369 isoform X2 n=1 Tax=Macrobrachium nipponense TaxID=159736 RepID=UPI0030C83590
MRLILFLLIGSWVATSSHAWLDFSGSRVRHSSSHDNHHTSHKHHGGSSSTGHHHGSHSHPHGNEENSSNQPEKLKTSDNSKDSKVHNCRGASPPKSEQSSTSPKHDHHHHHHHHKAKESPADNHKGKLESGQGKAEKKWGKHTQGNKHTNPNSAKDKERKSYKENTLHPTDWHTSQGHYHRADEHGNQFRSTSYRGNNRLHHPHYLQDGDEHKHPDPSDDDASGVHDPHHSYHRRHHHHHHHKHHGSSEHGGHQPFLYGHEHLDFWHSSKELPIQLCPMHYTSIGHRCIAIFSIGQTSWWGANSFCESIYGELLFFKNIQEYLEFLEFLQNSDLNLDLWVGGKTDGRSWRWIDGSQMPMGSPYWAIRTSHFPSWRTNEEHYYQTPSKIVTPHAGLYQSKCASMSSKYYYYMSDENCDDRRSPVCVLKNDAEIVVLKQWAVNGNIPVTSSPNSDESTEEEEEEDESSEEEGEEEEDESSEEEGEEEEEEEEKMMMNPLKKKMMNPLKKMMNPLKKKMMNPLRRMNPLKKTKMNLLKKKKKNKKKRKTKKKKKMKMMINPLKKMNPLKKTKMNLQKKKKKKRRNALRKKRNNPLRKEERNPLKKIKKRRALVTMTMRTARILKRIKAKNLVKDRATLDGLMGSPLTEEEDD